VGSDGTLTAISGSPVVTPGAVEATNGKFLFGTDGITIYTFSVASDGTIQQVASLNAQQYNSKTMSGGPCGGPTKLFLDRTGSDLYDLDAYSDCANNAYQSFSIDSTSGALSYLAVTSTTTPIFETPLSFLSDDQFAYGASCYHWLQTIYGAARNSDGALTALALNPGIDPAMPTAVSGQIYCPYLTATDAANNVAVAVQPFDNASLQTVGPYQLATYAADNSGNLTTTSTDSNMPTTAVTNTSSNSLTGIAISPSGSLLAVAGTGGLQVFHFNGANPITTYTSPLTTDEIDQIAWDKSNHLYAISQSKGKLYVFTVTTTTYSQASGSPYAISNPGNLVVLSQ
jgi:WD40 repeat protein